MAENPLQTRTIKGIRGDRACPQPILECDVMVSLILTGLLSGFFFSATFVLNRLMSLEGGHWFWSASLRYGFMILFSLVLLMGLQGLSRTRGVIRLFFKHWIFWTLAGTVGFGFFYALICFGADHAPGWVIAATWQLTIIASLVVLLGFGQRFPKKIWLFSLVIFSGVLMVNLDHGTGSLDWGQVLAGGLPVLVAAFCYPIGNQMVWEAKTGSGRLPRIDSPLMDNPFNKVLLLSLGSIPFWGVLFVILMPPPPTGDQVMNTALVALLSGIVATSLFLLARGRAERPHELAAVDATQSSEVIFALVGEMVILGAPLPGAQAIVGMGIVFIGLAFFIRFQESH